MIYRFLKTICKLALKVYFRKMHINGLENIPEKGPYLIVANHPSSFLDPLCIATNTKPKISFLAKGVLFKNKIIAAILRRLNMVPIYRAEDNPKLVSRNKEVFNACYQKLALRKVIMIFPEGTSEMERRLRKIKTGAARIALGAEKEHNYSLNIKIVPVGLNYTNSSRFRSEVVVNFGEPIMIKDYIEHYKNNEIETVKALTQDIENAIREQMIAINKQEHDELVERVERIYKTSLVEENNSLEDVKISQGITEAVDYYYQTEPQLYDNMANQIDRYFLKLKEVKLSDKSVEKMDKRKRFIPELFKSFFALLLGFPFWLFGIVSSYIPYKLPRIVALKITDSEAFYGALLMSLGTMFFILFYSVEIVVFWLFTQHALLTLCFGVMLVLSGFYTIYYARNARRLYFNLQLALKLNRKKELVKELVIERKRLIKQLNEIKVRYEEVF